MRPLKKQLPTLMLSLCIAASSLLACHWGRPIPSTTAHVSTEEPFDSATAPWSAARVLFIGQPTLARGMTFKKLLRRRAIG